MSNPDATSNENAAAALARARNKRVDPVLIAGGGIAGLAAAIALARRGIPSHVLERRPAFGEEGAGIQIGPNGTRILRDLGVADVLRPYVGLPELIRVRDGASGKELAHLPLGRWIAARHGAPYWVAQRSDLHAVLLQAVRDEPLIALSMGFNVAEVAADAEMVAVATDRGESWTGRALIAADGIWSGIRARYFQAGLPQFVGKSAVRTLLPVDFVAPEFQRPETALWLFPDAHVVHYPVAAGNALAVVVIFNDERDDLEWSAPVHPGWVQQNMPPCVTPLRDLIAQAQAWRKWGLHSLAVAQAWSRGPVALIGDAAHPVLPYLAQGGVMALEDAAVLAAALGQTGTDIAAALRNYESKRRPRAYRIADASRRNGRLYHLSGSFARARNMMLRTVPPDRLMARYDWLYGWQPN
jgi:salicylate hydroxylase